MGCALHTKRREQQLALTANFIIHRRRFYDELNTVSDDSMKTGTHDSITLMFDMMENQVLPKSDIGAAYYARQLHLYILGIVRHRGAGGTQGKEDILFYTWLESQNRKNRSMVSSALQHCLKSYQSELQRKTSLKLFCDSAFGQNKNWNMVSMMMSMRKKNFQHLQINHTFHAES